MWCSFAGFRICRATQRITGKFFSKGVYSKRFLCGESPAALSDLLQAQQFWMALALHGLMRLFDQLIDPACALHHPSIGSVLFQYRCTACTLLCRRTPGDPAVSADAVLGKRDQILHIKPRGSLLPLWLWLTCMNLTWSYSCSVWRNWS